MEEEKEKQKLKECQKNYREANKFLVKRYINFLWI